MSGVVDLVVLIASGVVSRPDLHRAVPHRHGGAGHRRDCACASPGRAVANAANDANNIATVLSEQTAQSVQAIDSITHRHRRTIRQHGRHTPTKNTARRCAAMPAHRFWRTRLSRIPQTDFVALIDRDGQLLNTSRTLAGSSGATLPTAITSSTRARTTSTQAVRVRNPAQPGQRPTQHLLLQTHHRPGRRLHRRGA